ncbi:MAG TPA: carboxypeptidase-like regulatory domain-containing protein, partial [Planctomycetota bacterium]|nr:carboxypeptidase-like regulatory domain-containing protein [Planctomycetota bacterium]
GADGAENAFRFGELQAGAWTLSVAAPGWLASKPLVLDVKPGEQREDLEVLLQHGATLRVLLLGADSAPAPGREVVVQRADAAPDSSPWKAVTGAEGQALFDALPPVAMELSAFPGARAQVTLSPAQPTEVTLALRRQPRVRGRVTAGGAPVPGASVVASLRTDLPGMGGVFITDDTTSVKASALGGFELQLQRPGEVLLVAHDPADPDASSSVPVTLTMDWDQEQRADLAFGGARVAGLIVDATTQQPLPGAWVVACPHGPILDMDFDRYSSLLQAEARSGDDGRFLLPRVQPGPVQLRVSAKGYSRVVLEDVAALEGDTVEAPRVELSRGTVLTGVVRTASGRTLPPGLRVSVRESADADAAASAGVGEDGSWRIAGHTLAPGAWTLCVEREEVQVFAREMKPAPLASVQVQLVAGDNAPVDLVIDA